MPSPAPRQGPLPAAPRLGVLLSGGGRTLQNLVERTAAGRLRATIECVVADRAEALGLQRAAAAGVPHACVATPADVWPLLREHRVDLVCLCGYLRLLPIAADYRNKVLNLHPALLPRPGGKGLVGHPVHSGVLGGGARRAGCTGAGC